MDALLEHERLDVYRVAVELHRCAMLLLPKRGATTVREQMDRASLSIVLNIAEGAGRRAAPDKQRFYEMARGSATEVGALVDVIRARGLAAPRACDETRVLAVRVVQMLSKLVGPVR